MRRLNPFIVVSLLLIGCASKHIDSAKLTEKEAIQVAVSFAQKSAHQIDYYRAPRASYSARSKDWWVWFYEKPPGHPGGDMIISVDDLTGAAEFVPTR